MTANGAASDPPGLTDVTPRRKKLSLFPPRTFDVQSNVTTPSICSDLAKANQICPFSRTTTCYAIDNHEPHMIGDGCRRWRCPVCGPRKRWRLVLRVVAAKPNRMVTLTCRHEVSPEHQHTSIVRSWPKLTRHLRSTLEGECEYLRITEQCADGYPHFHALFRSSYIERDEVVKLWQRETGAHIVDIRKAHGRSASYVAKYLTKACSSSKEFSRQRITVSKNFFPRVTESSSFSNFEHSNEHPYEFVERKSSIHTFVRKRPCLYHVIDREAGDEIPPELLPIDERGNDE